MQKIATLFILFILFFGSHFSVSAQLEFPEDKVSWSFSVDQKGSEATIIGKIKVVDHWHINATKLPAGSFGFPTSVDLKKSSNYKAIGGVIEPKPIEIYDELADEKLAYHEGSFILKRKIKVLSEKDFELSGSFIFQTCNEVKCLPDYTAGFKLKIKGCAPEDSTAAIENDDNASVSADKIAESDESISENDADQNVKNTAANKISKSESDKTKSSLTDLIKTIIIGFILVAVVLMFFMGVTNA